MSATITTVNFATSFNQTDVGHSLSITDTSVYSANTVSVSVRLKIEDPFGVVLYNGLPNAMHDILYLTANGAAVKTKTFSDLLNSASQGGGLQKGVYKITSEVRVSNVIVGPITDTKTAFKSLKICPLDLKPSLRVTHDCTAKELYIEDLGAYPSGLGNIHASTSTVLLSYPSNQQKTDFLIVPSSLVFNYIVPILFDGEYTLKSNYDMSYALEGVSYVYAYEEIYNTQKYLLECAKAIDTCTLKECLVKYNAKYLANAKIGNNSAADMQDAILVLQIYDEILALINCKGNVKDIQAKYAEFEKYTHCDCGCGCVEDGDTDPLGSLIVLDAQSEAISATDISGLQYGDVPEPTIISIKSVLQNVLKELNNEGEWHAFPTNAFLNGWQATVSNGANLDFKYRKRGKKVELLGFVQNIIPASAATEIIINFSVMGWVVTKYQEVDVYQGFYQGFVSGGQPRPIFNIGTNSTLNVSFATNGPIPFNGFFLLD